MAKNVKICNGDGVVTTDIINVNSNEANQIKKCFEKEITGKVELFDSLTATKEKLFQTANDIKFLQLKNLEYYENIANTKKRCDIIRNSIMNVIANEVDDKGKKVYSNADSRQTEFEIRIKDNIDYSNDIAFVKQLEDTIAKNNIEISYNDRLFKYYEILCK